MGAPWSAKVRTWARHGTPRCALWRARARQVERTLALADFACVLHASTRMQNAYKVGAGAIPLKSFFQKDSKGTALRRIIYIADVPPPPYNGLPPPGPTRGDLGTGTSPGTSYIYIICASGEETGPTRPHEVYLRKPGGEKADGTRRLETIRQTLRVPDPQMTPEKRFSGGR